MDGFFNPGHYAEAIELAKNGNEQSELFLRLRLGSMANKMPLDLLVQISETILAYRKQELQDEAEAN